MRASTTTILDGSGNAKVSYEYTDFGETTAKGDFYNEICYTGGIYDKTTGLYYLNARYYDPDDGRFVTQDTYRGDMNDPGSLHLYAYCANNPVNYVDPSGHYRQYSARHTFTYHVFLGVLTFTLAVKWKVANKKITETSLEAKHSKMRFNNRKITISHAISPAFNHKNQRALLRWFLKISPDGFYDVILPAGVSPSTYLYPSVIVYNDGGRNWYRNGRNMRL